ncbi:MAG: BamA/TamA family outer membrane protein [Bacteroidetes bacterium]|nr:BamA/TamA family outer membrane protein [Bacteroidota bacterium]
MIIIFLFNTSVGQEIPVQLHGFPSLNDVESLPIDGDPFKVSENLAQNKSKIVTTIFSKLAENGHYFPAIDSLVFDGYRILVYGSEGSVSLIARIDWVIPDSLSVLVPNQTEELPVVFSNSIIDKNSLRFLELAGKAGYPFATVRPEIKLSNQNKDTIFYSVTFISSDFKRVQLSGITADGTENVSNKTLERVAAIKNGQLFSEREAVAIQGRLKRSELFETVDLPTFQLTDDDNFKWFVKVKELPSTRFDGVLGYLPASKKGEDGYFTGLVKIHMRNFLGNARKLNLYWVRENQYSQEFNFYFMEPWVFDKQIDLWTSLSQRNQDTTFVKRGFSAGSELRFFDPLTIRLDGQFESIVGLSNLRSRVNGPDVLNSEKFLGGLGAGIDTRNSYFNASEGYRVSVNFQFGVKTITGPDSVLTPAEKKSSFMRRSVLEAETYVAITRQQIVAGFFRFWETRVPDIDLPDMFLVGGIQNLRGYRENQFYASSLAMASLEYRFLLSERSYVFLFSDTAFLERAKINRTHLKADKGVYPGAGGGAILSSPLGIVKVIFGMGKGDTFSTAKIHFGLVNEF